MADFSDWVSDATPRECAELGKVLRAGEELRWAVRPLPRLIDCVRWDMWFFGLVWTFFVCVGALSMMGWPPGYTSSQADDLYLLPPFFLAGLVILLWPLVKRWRVRHSLYIFTQRRVILLEPGFKAWRHYLWALNRDLLLMRRIDADGRGSLFFSREYFLDARYAHDGLGSLPDVREAEERLLKLISERRKQPQPAKSGKHVEDFVNNLTAREREELNNALFPDEADDILWATRSLAGLQLGGWKDLPHIFTGDHHLCPQLYVLTPRRALLLQPQLVGAWKTRAYRVQRGMVLRKRLREQGRGDLIFAEVQGKNGSFYYGFMNLADMAEAEQAVECAVAQRNRMQGVRPPAKPCGLSRDSQPARHFLQVTRAEGEGTGGTGG